MFWKETYGLKGHEGERDGEPGRLLSNPESGVRQGREQTSILALEPRLPLQEGAQAGMDGGPWVWLDTVEPAVPGAIHSALPPALMPLSASPHLCLSGASRT